jgi:uncharacterized protein involved in exopolysaccharide biosynthesis
MKRELAKLEGGVGGVGESKAAATNSAGFENLRRFRDMKFLERLTELLTQQFEAAKIDEAKNATLVQVLDRAVEPDKKSQPRRALIVVLTVLAAGVVSVFWAFAKEALERERNNPQGLRRLQVLRGYLLRPQSSKSER